MDAHQIKYREKLAAHLIKKLTSRRLAASFAPTAAQAREEIVAMIPAGATVSRCGSMSLVEMGLWEALAQKPGVEIINPFGPGVSPEEAYALMRRGLLADFMITSSPGGHFRFTISSAHAEEDIERLLDTLGASCR